MEKAGEAGKLDRLANEALADHRAAVERLFEHFCAATPKVWNQNHAFPAKLVEIAFASARG